MRAPRPKTLAGRCALVLIGLLASSPAAGQPATTQPQSPTSAVSTQTASQPTSQPAARSGEEVNPARRLLRGAIDLYMVGRYREAAALLRPLVEARVLKDRADQQEALRIYGITLFLSGARVGSERAFRHLLRIAPHSRLDRSFVRPEVVSYVRALVTETRRSRPS